MCSHGTSSPDFSETRLYWMCAPVPSSNWLKWMSCWCTAEYSFTGTFTRPKLIEPLQMARGIGVPPSSGPLPAPEPGHPRGCVSLMAASAGDGGGHAVEEDVAAAEVPGAGVDPAARRE